MKKLIVLIVLYLVGIKVNSQINIGKGVSPINLYVSKLKQKEFDYLKQTTTVFVVPDYLELELFEEIIGDLWTFNEIIFVKEKEFNKKKRTFMSKEFSRIVLADDAYKKEKGLVVVAEYIQFSFLLVASPDTYMKKGKLKYKSFNAAEVFFTPSISFRRGVVSKSGRAVFLQKDKGSDIDDEPDFYNFTPGHIKNYFQFMNNMLVKNENFAIRDGLTNKAKLSELKNQTLYIPKWILKKYNALNVSESETREVNKIFDKYEHSYKIISNAELNSKILNEEEVYYLMHTQFNNVKVISIINSLTGEIIYLSEEKSFNFKKSDISQINRLIK